MEFLLLLFIVASFVGQVLVTRYFFKQLIRKLSLFTTQTPREGKTAVMTAKTTMPQPPEGLFADKPAKNQVTEENGNEIDYDENVFVPRDVKVELEGGDSQVPPGYEEKEPVTL